LESGGSVQQLLLLGVDSQKLLQSAMIESVTVVGHEHELPVGEVGMDLLEVLQQRLLDMLLRRRRVDFLLRERKAVEPTPFGVDDWSEQSRLDGRVERLDVLELHQGSPPRIPWLGLAGAGRIGGGAGDPSAAPGESGGGIRTV